MLGVRMETRNMPVNVFTGAEMSHCVKLTCTHVNVAHLKTNRMKLQVLSPL